MNIFARLAQMMNGPVTPTVTVPAGIPQNTRTKTTSPTIAVVNKSTVLNDDEIKLAVAAIQIQVDRDFEPVWNLGANLIFVSIDQIIPEGAWVVYLLDHSDQAGALGYHEITNNGLPVAKIFAADDQKYGLSWTVTLSHEILESLADPWINFTVFVQQSNTTGVLFPIEVADAVEDDSFGYKINDILVSDFVYPSWFESWRTKGSTQFSYMKSVTAPFEIAEGGYIGFFDVSSSTSGWQQATGPSGAGQRLLARGPDCRVAKREKNNFHPLVTLNVRKPY